MAMIRRVDLWLEGLRAAAAHLRRRWWRSPPRVPSVSGPHLAWRLATAYGDASHPLESDDLVDYLAWRRRQRRARR